MCVAQEGIGRGQGLSKMSPTPMAITTRVTNMPMTITTMLTCMGIRRTTIMPMDMRAITMSIDEATSFDLAQRGRDC